MNNDDLFEMNNGNDLEDEDIAEVVEDEEDLAIDAIFARKKNHRSNEHSNDEAAVHDDVQVDPPAHSRENGDSRAAHQMHSRHEHQPHQEEHFTAADVNEIAGTISHMLENGKLTGALEIALSLNGKLREAVRDTVTVTIPLGSHDKELRQIAAGAMIQSYLEQGRIVREDIEDKLFAIIESSEPEYDDDDEIIEQTPDEILYKVTACMVFCAQLTELCGAHPAFKSVMYGAEDSVLDSFLSENIGDVIKKQRRHITALADAVRANGGTVSAKLDSYLTKSRSGIVDLVMRFLGDSFAFRVTACVIAVLCLVSVIVYLSDRSGFLSLIATDNVVMLYVIGAEVFFTVGMVLLAILIGFKSSVGPDNTGRNPRNTLPGPQNARQRRPER